MEFSIGNLLVAMGAGVFGVAIGGLASFIFVEILIFVGVAILAGGGEGASSTMLPSAHTVPMSPAGHAASPQQPGLAVKASWPRVEIRLPRGWLE